MIWIHHNQRWDHCFGSQGLVEVIVFDCDVNQGFPNPLVLWTNSCWRPHVCSSTSNLGEIPMWCEEFSVCQTRHGKHPLVAPIDWTLTSKVGPVVEASSNWSLKLPAISTINNHYIWQCMASWTIPIIHLYIPSYLLFKALRIHHQASVAASASWPVVALPSAASPAGFQLCFEFGLAKDL